MTSPLDHDVLPVLGANLALDATDYLIAVLVERARTSPTRTNHEALAAAGEALARLRFVAAALSDESLDRNPAEAPTAKAGA